MNLKEYEDFVVNIISEDSMRDFKAKIGTGGLGLAGEAGECADIAKKVCFQGLQFNDSTKEKLMKELGDVMFYLTFTSVVVCGVDLQTIIDGNFEKLNARYKSGKFSVEEFMDKESKKD